MLQPDKTASSSVKEQAAAATVPVYPVSQTKLVRVGEVQAAEVHEAMSASAVMPVYPVGTVAATLHCIAHPERTASALEREQAVTAAVPMYPVSQAKVPVTVGDPQAPLVQEVMASPAFPPLRVYPVVIVGITHAWVHPERTALLSLVEQAVTVAVPLKPLPVSQAKVPVTVGDPQAPLVQEVMASPAFPPLRVYPAVIVGITHAWVHPERT